MPSLLTNNVFFKLLSHADWLSHGLFWLLLGMSFACWWIFIYKLHGFAAKQTLASSALARLHNVTTIDELVRCAGTFGSTLPGTIMSTALAAEKKCSQLGQITGNSLFGQHEQALVTMCLDEKLAALIKQEEKSVPFLKLSAESGTLIGLFGTVWGLIGAFNKISERQMADIPTVAPGIAEALIITLTGLFVAIPALIMYYVITHKIKHLEDTLSASADRIEWIITASHNSPHGIRIPHETPLSQNTK